MKMSPVIQIVTYGATCLKYWFKRNVVFCKCQNRVEGKVVIITGATAGIGYCTALDLAKKGSILYLACRNQETGKETAEQLRKLSGNEKIEFMYLDLKKFSTIRDFVEEFKKREKKLDILINNAAIFHHPSSLTDDGIEITFQTNYLGGFLLTTLLQNILQQTNSSRVLFVSSEAHKLVSTEDLVTFNPEQPAEINTFMDYVNVYGISKLAIHAYADHLSKTCPEILVILINPGNVWSSIYRHAWLSWGEIMTRIKCAFYMSTPEEGAQSSIHALNAPEVPHRTYITNQLDTEKLEDYSEVSDNLVMNSKKLLNL